MEAHAQSACSAGTINLSTGATALTGERTRKELLVRNVPAPCQCHPASVQHLHFLLLDKHSE